jgi:negative regulator of flagellin synthesis FlgM
MKIGTPLDAQAAAGVSLRTGRAAGTAAAPSSAVATDKVAVSAAGAKMGAASSSSDFDAAKVDAIRQAIREGRFTVNPGAIADRLIADAAALLGPRGA